MNIIAIGRVVIWTLVRYPAKKEAGERLVGVGKILQFVRKPQDAVEALDVYAASLEAQTLDVAV